MSREEKVSMGMFIMIIVLFICYTAISQENRSRIVTHDSYCTGAWVGCLQAAGRTELTGDDCKGVIADDPLCAQSDIVKDWEAEDGN